jgi:hypothetical protein
MTFSPKAVWHEKTFFQFMHLVKRKDHELQRAQSRTPARASKQASFSAGILLIFHSHRGFSPVIAGGE